MFHNILVEVLVPYCVLI